MSILEYFSQGFVRDILWHGVTTCFFPATKCDLPWDPVTIWVVESKNNNSQKLILFWDIVKNSILKFWLLSQKRINFCELLFFFIVVFLCWNSEQGRFFNCSFWSKFPDQCPDGCPDHLNRTRKCPQERRLERERSHSRERYITYDF